MSKTSCFFSLSMVLCGALSLWACTSEQSPHGEKASGTGGGMAGAGGTSPAGGTGGNGGVAGDGGSVVRGGAGGLGGAGGSGGTGGRGGSGGSLPHEDYWCGTYISIYPCGGASGAGGSAGGTGGTKDRDASGEGLDVGPTDAPYSEAAPDLAVVEAPVVGTDSVGVDSDGVLRGYQVYGNELMAFELCGSGELIWMNLTGWEKGLDRIPAQGCPGDAGPSTCVRHLYTELAGTISSPGSYGHLGKFSRELRVQEFLVVNLDESPTCPFLPPVYPN